MESPTKSLRVDLSVGSVQVVSVDQSLIESFLGGSGLAIALAVQDFAHDPDPLGPENPLLFAPGYLTGTPVPAACKGCFVARSPLTGLWSQSTIGGHWPSRLARLGWSLLVITGKASSPVYLVIDEEGGFLEDAETLWGLDTYDAERVLYERHGPRTEVAGIGPAGENLIPMASIMAGGRHARAAGRTGLGAVMGSKNLKALALLPPKDGAHKRVREPSTLRDFNKEIIPRVADRARLLSEFGTAGGVVAVELSGDLPIANWTRGSWQRGARVTSGQAIAESGAVKGHYACFGCPIRCGKSVEVRKGPYSGTVSHGPEYETCAGFGAMCLNEDVEWLIAANDFCNRMGIDTISASSAVAFGMECFESGLLKKSDIGFDLPWGDGEAMFKVLELIVRRQGIGEVLCQGTRKAAQAIGGISQEFAVHVKGLEVPYHDPRAFTSMAVNYATATRGACHLEGLTYFVENKAFPGSNLGLKDDWDPHGTEGKANLAKTMQDYMAVMDSLGLCKFLIRGHVGPKEVVSWLNAVSGWGLSVEELMKRGADIFNLKRWANQRLGVSRKDDILPPRLLTHDRATGGAAGSLPHLGKMLSEYYKLRNWTSEGVVEHSKHLMQIATTPNPTLA